MPVLPLNMFGLVPQGHSKSGNSLEQVWTSCPRLLVAAFRCWEANPQEIWTELNVDACAKSRVAALSCVDKSLDWESWDALLQCRERQRAMASYKQKNPEAPPPISCREEALACRAHRDRFFGSFLTKEVADFNELLKTARNTCKKQRQLYWQCSETKGGQSIECLDLEFEHNNCMMQQLAPIEFVAYEKCRQENPSVVCKETRAMVRSKMDQLALEATQSLGFGKPDYNRYGGSYKTFEVLVFPFLHLGGLGTQLPAYGSPKPVQSSNSKSGWWPFREGSTTPTSKPEHN